MKIATILNTVWSRTRSIAAELAGLTVPLIALATLAAPGLASFGSDQDYRAEDGSGARGGADNDPGTYARVRFYSGTLKLERYEDETVDEGAVNAPIMPGDTAATSGGGRAEIQLAGGSVVRLDEKAAVCLLEQGKQAVHDLGQELVQVQGLAQVGANLE